MRTKAKPPQVSEEYFPERSAIANHMQKLNDLISAQRRDQKVRMHQAMSTTTNESYGDFYSTSRKQRPPRQYFDPWYRSSLEYGKYVAPLPQPELPSYMEQLVKKRMEDEANAKRDKRQQLGPALQFHRPLKLPPIESNQASGAGADERHLQKLSEAKRKRLHQSEEDLSHNNHNNKRKMHRNVSNYMSLAMGRLWNRIEHLNSDTTDDVASVTKNATQQAIQKRPVPKSLVSGLEAKKSGTMFSHSIPSSGVSSIR